MNREQKQTIIKHTYWGQGFCIALFLFTLTMFNVNAGAGNYAGAGFQAFMFVIQLACFFSLTKIRRRVRCSL